MTSHTFVSSASRAIALALFLGCSNQHAASHETSRSRLAAASSPARPSKSTTKAPIDAQWQARVERRIAAGEYALRPDGERLRAHNRSHGFDVAWQRGAVEIHAQSLEPELAAKGAGQHSRPPTAAKLGPSAGKLSVSTRAFARGDRRVLAQSSTFAPGACRADGELDAAGKCLRRAEARGHGWVEWWENRDDGLEQGYDLTAPPLARSGSQPLRIELAVQAVNIEVAQDGSSAVFAAGGRERMKFAQLDARDRSGRTLPIRIAPISGGVALEVDDREAQYPIRIDPLLQNINWAVRSNWRNQRFGYTVASAGDINGDGYGDIAIGAAHYNNSHYDEGAAFVYLGGPTGLGGSAAWQYESDSANAFFSYAMTPGDFNCDGFSDLAVGAPFYGAGQQGRVYVFNGSAQGLSQSPSKLMEVTETGANLGMALASEALGGDGCADLMVGAPGSDNGQTDEGRVYIALGQSGAGLGGFSSGWEPNVANARFGSYLSAVGSFSSTTSSQVAIGAPGWTSDSQTPNRGGVWVLGGTSTFSSIGVPPARGSQANEELAIVAGLGDVNGDGFADFAVGSTYYDAGSLTDAGRVAVYYGGNGIFNPNFVDFGEQANGHFGFAVASAGDFNGDGYADMVVGAADEAHGDVAEGASYVYFGSAAGLIEDKRIVLPGDQHKANYGAAVACAGDVNGDGFSDLIIGAPWYSGAKTDEGRAVVYYGSAAEPSTLATTTIEGQTPFDQTLGYLAVASAGDINGDGFSDVVIGAPWADNTSNNDEGRVLIFLGSATGLSTTASSSLWGGSNGPYFGWSAAGAGDVNSDGFDDIIVGASRYSNGQNQEGQVLLFRGGPGGIETAPAWRIESNQAGAMLGSSVASAGDVNGDGFGDVIVGASSYSNQQTQEGKAWIYLGAANGLATTATWTQEANQNNANYGTSVAGVGDVNRDGYGDVVVAAPNYDNGQTDEGKVYLYRGSASGMQSTTWSPEGDQAGALFGSTVAPAGDVNGDGCADVIVAARAYDVPISTGATIIDGGRVQVYYGSNATGSQGLDSVGWMVEGSTTQAATGAGVGSAGDVNGDGYADVVVGAPSLLNNTDGAVYLYYGSATGLNVFSAWSVAATGVRFGATATGVGDVNGDGFSDIMIGSPFANQPTPRGRIQLYTGNGYLPFLGKPVRVQARRNNSTTPISAHGKTFTTFGFDVNMANARGPMGGNAVMLVAEAKPLGQPFGASPNLPFDPWRTVQTNNGISVTTSVTGTNGSRLHWRARLQYVNHAGAYWQHSRWFYGIAGDPLATHLLIAP